jgi:UDP-N-acetylglucosamine--N-acetylmuramyl-(pentapeptide) pyrophosphoryl-undecaprenol N-acetylglucosamine transferase
VFVPLPHGNGEQALNAGPVVSAGGGLIVRDEELTPSKVESLVVPLMADRARLAAMSAATLGTGRREADEILARTVLEVTKK